MAPGPLSNLLGAARRRAIGHTLLNESAFALALAMGGAVLLLLAGTQILDWYWLVILFVGSLAVGLWRARRSIPSEYVIAQRVDRTMGLADTLSTATYFDANRVPVNAEMRDMQRAEAERTASSVDVAAALPFVMPRVLYPAAGLLLVALGLFAVRYGMLGSLNLQPSLVSIAFDSFFNPDSKALAKNLGRKSPADLKKLTVPADASEQQPPGNEMTPDNLLDTVDVPNVNGSEQGTETKSAAKGPQNQQAEQGDGEQKGDKGQEGGEQGNQASGQQSQNDSKQDGSKEGKQAQNGKQGDSSSSLMDKMKDALANLMDKMKPQQSKQGESQQGKGQQDGKQGQMQGAQKGQQARNQSNQNGAESPDAKGQQQGEGGEKSQSAQSKGGEKSGDNSQSQDGKSGVGKQDGNKDAKEAEQLEAMGKISEIIGKRQQNLSGEVMVEVSSSKQQIKTQYSGKNAAHVENGGEVHRDEVPLMYQQYVQQYFEEIRKAPAVPKTKPTN